ELARLGRKSGGKLRGELGRLGKRGEPLDQVGHGAATVRKDHTNVGAARGGPTEEQVRNRASGIGAPLDRPVTNIGQEIPAAICGVGVGEENRFTPVEFLEDRVERRITEPLISVAREQSDAVSLEGAKGIIN